ncbi:MAG: ABC transporter substrate-binding protein [Holosporales bacterium]|jgi:putative ABC transport system substrate-binding protein|nr:ABC transporter substrate-binding protein [Holosporales bacterium]
MAGKGLFFAIISGITLVILSIFFVKNEINRSGHYKVTICKVIEHEAINAVSDGIQHELREDPDFEFEISTCQGNHGVASQAVSKAASDGTEVLVTIGTTPTQAAFKLAKCGKLRLVFSSVTNPRDISASFASSNTTGVSNFIPLKPQIELFKRIQPNLMKLGIIYNSSESNSVAIVNALQPVLQEMGITLVTRCIQKSSDLPQAVNSIVGDVDAIFVSNDNTVLAGISLIIKVCNLHKIPVYVSDTDQVEKGCLAALGPNQFDIGRQTGIMIRKIKDGTDINDIKIEYPKTNELFINLKAAKVVEIDIPDDLINSANKVFGADRKK